MRVGGQAVVHVRSDPMVGLPRARSITLKENAEVMHHVLALGEPDCWEKGEAKPWTEPPGTGGGRQPGPVPNRAWEYYESRVNGRLRELLNMD